MGQLKTYHHIKFTYNSAFIALWKSMSQPTKDAFELIGKPFGYSGMNSFFIFLHIYATWTQTGVIDTQWRTKT